MRRNTNGCPVSARVKYPPAHFVVTSVPVLRERSFFNTRGEKFSPRRNLSEGRLTGRSGGREEASDGLCPSDCCSLMDSCSCGGQQADRPPSASHTVHFYPSDHSYCPQPG